MDLQVSGGSEREWGGERLFGAGKPKSTRRWRALRLGSASLVPDSGFFWNSPDVPIYKLCVVRNFGCRSALARKKKRNEPLKDKTSWALSTVIGCGRVYCTRLRTFLHWPILFAAVDSRPTN